MQGLRFNECIAKVKIRPMFKQIIETSIDFVVKLYPIQLKRKLAYYEGVIYNHWIKQYLGSVGNKTYFGSGLQLQGGVTKMYI